eukprot:6177131-Pleurochrysis_carterae.AAC.4
MRSPPRRYSPEGETGANGTDRVACGARDEIVAWHIARELEGSNRAREMVRGDEPEQRMSTDPSESTFRA